MIYATKRNKYETNLEEKIKNVENFDKEYHKLKEKTATNEVNRVTTNFSLNEGGYYYKKGDYIYLIQKILN